MGAADVARRRERFRRLLPFAAIALAPLVLAATSLDHPWPLEVERADAALYTAKAAGRDRVERADLPV